MNDYFAPSYDEIHEGCKEFAEFLKNHIDISLIVGISRGGLIPGVIISQLTYIPFKSIEYSSKDGNGDNKNHENLLPNLPKDKTILLVDDICDTGKTLEEVFNYYTEQGNSIMTFVLYWKSREETFRSNFAWRTILEDSPWIVFPWEQR